MSTNLQGYGKARFQGVRQDENIKIHTMPQDRQDEMVAAFVKCLPILERGYSLNRQDEHTSHPNRQSFLAGPGAAPQFISYLAACLNTPFRGRMIGEWMKSISLTDERELVPRGSDYESWLKITSNVKLDAPVSTGPGKKHIAPFVVDAINSFRDAYRMPLDKIGIDKMAAMLTMIAGATIETVKPIAPGGSVDVQFDTDIVVGFWHLVITFAQLYKVLTGESVKIHNIPVRMIDVMKHHNDDAFDKLLRMYICDKYTREYVRVLSETMTVKPSHLVMDRGLIYIGKPFYEQMITLIVKGFVHNYDLYRSALSDIDNFEQDRKYWRKLWLAQKETNFRPDLPLQLFIGPGLKRDDKTGFVFTLTKDRAAEAADVNFFKQKYAKVIDLFKSMIDEWYVLGKDDFAPTITHRQTNIGGNNVIYMMVWHDAYAPSGDIDALRYTAMQSEEGAPVSETLNKVDFVLHYELPTMPRSSVDRYKVTSFEHSYGGARTYNYAYTSDVFMNFWFNSLVEYQTYPMDSFNTKFLLKPNDTILTVKPPANMTHEYVLSDGANYFWVDNTRDFSVQEVKLEGASLLQKYFAIRSANLNRDPDALMSFYKSRLTRLMKMDFLGPEYAKCEIAWDSSMVPSIALMLATLGHRDASLARSLIAERVLPPGLSTVDKIPTEAFSLVTTISREVIVTFPSAISNIRTDNPLFKDDKDFFFKSASSDPTLLEVTRKPFYHGVKGLEHIVACRVKLDLAEDVSIRGGVKLLQTKDKIRIKLPTTLPKMASWENADYAVFLMTNARDYVDLFEFDQNNVDVLGSLASLYVSMMGQAYQKVSDVKALAKQFADLGAWVAANLNLDSFLQDAYPLISSWKWQQFVEACSKAAKELEGSAKGMSLDAFGAIWTGLFDTTFPASVNSGLPLFYVNSQMNVKTFLDDKMRGVSRFPSSDAFIETLKPVIPFAAFIDTGIASSLMRLYVDNSLRAMFDVRNGVRTI